MAARSTFKRSGPGLGPIEKAMAQLIRTRLLVGVPGDAAPRQPAPGEKGVPPSNALVGYIAEFGCDARRIPPRPFLVPGVRNAKPEITKGMIRAATGALSGRPTEIRDGFDQAGLAAVASVQAKMVAGGFVPLSQRTIEARARRRHADTGRLLGTATTKNARSFLKLQAEGVPDSVLHDAGLATPLLDTRSLYRSITHIVKER